VVIPLAEMSLVWTLSYALANEKIDRDCLQVSYSRYARAMQTASNQRVDL